MKMSGVIEADVQPSVSVKGLYSLEFGSSTLDTFHRITEEHRFCISRRYSTDVQFCSALQVTFTLQSLGTDPLSKIFIAIEEASKRNISHRPNELQQMKKKKTDELGFFLKG